MFVSQVIYRAFVTVYTHQHHIKRGFDAFRSVAGSFCGSTAVTLTRHTLVSVQQLCYHRMTRLQIETCQSLISYKLHGVGVYKQS